MKSSAILVAFATLSLMSGVAGAADKKKCLEAGPRGQELRDQGKLMDARELFIVCADPTCPPPVPTFCAEWLDDVKKKIPTLVLRVTDETGKDLTDAVVTLDDKSVTADGKPIDVDPGNHKVHVSRPGSKDADQAIVASAGERRIVTVKLDPDAPIGPKPPPITPTPTNGRPIPLGSWIGWGVGAVGLIGFGVFGVKANINYGDYKSSCGNHCANSAKSDVESTMVVADVFLIAGVVGAAVGTVVYLLSPPPAEQHAQARR